MKFAQIFSEKSEHFRFFLIYETFETVSMKIFKIP